MPVIADRFYNLNSESRQVKKLLQAGGMRPVRSPLKSPQPLATASPIAGVSDPSPTPPFDHDRDR